MIYLTLARRFGPYIALALAIALARPLEFQGTSGDGGTTV